ncbi:hypothetical protein WB44_07965 [Synechococcus sp. WH 8020]|uniref:DUF3119 family protein n=1 Tax=Synechococcus sp. (strain WH8020) TaxID=32052 RepID=UPI0006527D4A|nr:DUF3119 family protein [Synechococcus sp. WH 8020]AKN61045.1 hypothetical protein WB44_07965 [Synechococcus sp. WH 8020]
MTPSPETNSVIISPSPRLPLLILLLSASLWFLPLSPWPTLVVGLFSVFLLVQTYILKLEFSEEDLVVWRGQEELRRFPFNEWMSWRLFAPWLPGLFYFRESKNIHFLPILFNPAELQEQLEQRVGQLQQGKP